MTWWQIILAWIASHGPQPVPVPPSPPTPVRVSDLVAAINGVRAAHSLPYLTEVALLDQTAQAWANSMATAGVLDHGAFAQRIQAAFPGVAAAEDIAEGQPTATDVVAAWMADPGHAANILGPYSRVGGGSARSTSGATYWVVDFIQ
jgi:uncharacterized protein YkwD